MYGWTIPRWAGLVVGVCGMDEYGGPLDLESQSANDSYQVLADTSK